MTAADILARHGILRAPEVVDLADGARLDLACAAVLLIKESGGGRNVWGSDPVPTAGTYAKGSIVTPAHYLAYRSAVAQGAAGRQGCGPTQLTFGPFQAQADRAGGCWDWRANVTTGFSVLADLIAAHGVRGGFRRYNGSGPPAERYADDALAKLTHWRALLADTTQEDDVALTDGDIERIALRLAGLVWQHPIRNAFGDVVEARQILNGTEKRTAEILDIVQQIDEATSTEDF